MKKSLVFVGLFLILSFSFGVFVSAQDDYRDYIIEEGYGSLKLTFADTDVKESCNDVIEGISTGCTSTIAVYGDDFVEKAGMTISLGDFEGKEVSHLELLEGIDKILKGEEFNLEGKPKYISIGNREEGFHNIISVKLNPDVTGENSELSLWISDNKFISLIIILRERDKESRGLTLEEFLRYEYLKKYPSDLIYGYDSDLNIVLQTGQCKYLNNSCIEKELNEDENDSENEQNNEEVNLICSSGCILNESCVSIGYRKSGEYCSLEGNFILQLETDNQCNNSFECGSNVCVNNQCVSGDLIQRILNWFRKVFGGE